jgi:hypothetical protein
MPNAAGSAQEHFSNAAQFASKEEKWREEIAKGLAELSRQLSESAVKLRDTISAQRKP